MTDFIVFNQVRKFRKLLNVTQDNLALISGVSQGQISDIELSRCGCNLETALRIHRALQIYYSEDFPDKHLYFEDLFYLDFEGGFYHV